MQPKKSVLLEQIRRWTSGVQIDELSQNRPRSLRDQFDSGKLADGAQQLKLTSFAKNRLYSLRIKPARTNQSTRPQRQNLTSLFAQLRFSIQATQFMKKKRKYYDENPNDIKKKKNECLLEGLHMSRAPGPTKRKRTYIYIYIYIYKKGATSGKHRDSGISRRNGR